jgi:hypothetical protein
MLVLAALCLRAVVPAGFMLAPVDGRVSFVLCDPAVLAAAHAMHTAHDPAIHGHAAHHHDSHVDPTCPYAQSAGPAPLPTLPALAGGPVSVGLLLPTEFAQIFVQFGPTRQQFPRGPPQLA